MCVADALRFLMIDVSLLDDEPIAYLVCLGEVDSGLLMKIAGDDLCFEEVERGSMPTLRLHGFSRQTEGEGLYFTDGEPHVVRWAKAQSEDGLLSARDTHAAQCLSRKHTVAQRLPLHL